MNDVSLELHRINKNLERLIKVQKQQNDLLQQIINKPTYVPCVPNTPSNPDWLSAPPGYIGDWLPVRKE